MARNTAMRAERKGEPDKIESACGVLEIRCAGHVVYTYMQGSQGRHEARLAAGKRESPCSCNMNRITGFRRLGFGPSCGRRRWPARPGARSESLGPGVGMAELCAR